MKNLSIIIVLLVFCVLFFSACKKEEELSTREKIIGVWMPQLLKIDIYNENGEFVDIHSRTIELFGGTMEYKSNGRFEFIDNNNPSSPNNYGGIWELVNDSTLYTEYKIFDGSRPNNDSIIVNRTSIIKEISDKSFIYYHKTSGVSSITGENLNGTISTTLVKL